MSTDDELLTKAHIQGQIKVALMVEELIEAWVWSQTKMLMVEKKKKMEIQFRQDSINLFFSLFLPATHNY